MTGPAEWEQIKNADTVLPPLLERLHGRPTAHPQDMLSEIRYACDMYPKFQDGWERVPADTSPLWDIPMASRTTRQVPSQPCMHKAPQHVFASGDAELEAGDYMRDNYVRIPASRSPHSKPDLWTDKFTMQVCHNLFNGNVQDLSLIHI